MGFSYSSPTKLIHSPINCCLSVFISLLWTVLKGLLFISLFKEPSRAPGIYKKCLLNEWMKDFPDSEIWSWATNHLLSYFPHYFYSSSTILILIVWTCVSVLHISLQCCQIYLVFSNVMQDISHIWKHSSHTGRTHRSWALWFLIMATCPAQRV